LLPLWKAKITTKKITAQTRIGIMYYYKSTDKGGYSPITILYTTDQVEVISVGNNDSIDDKRSKAEPSSTLFQDLMRPVFDPVPGYGRQLEVNSDVFFTPGNR